MSRKRVVVLSAAERAHLEAVLRQPSKERRRVRARILLLTDRGYSDEAIAAEVHADRSTVERTRRKFVEEGLVVALTERPRPGGKPVLDGPDKAVLAELAGSSPPAGRRWWTMQLLADELVRREVVATVSDESVRRALHKMRLVMAQPNRSPAQRRAARRSEGVNGQPEVPARGQGSLHWWPTKVPTLGEARVERLSPPLGRGCRSRV